MSGHKRFRKFQTRYLRPIPYFIRLVALALGILGNIIVRGSDEFRVFRAIGGHLDST